MREEQSILPPTMQQTGVDKRRDCGGICRREQLACLGGAKRWRAVGNLAGDGICATGIVLRFTLKSHEGPDKNKRSGHKAPQRTEGNERAEGDGAAALTRPQHSVDDEEHQEEHARHGEGYSHRDLKLCTLFELFAHARSDVSGHDT